MTLLKPFTRACGLLLAFSVALPLSAQRAGRRRITDPPPPTLADSLKAELDRKAEKLELERTNKRAAADSVGGRAVVENDRVVFTLVRPKIRSLLTTERSKGLYVWRVDVTQGEPLSFVVSSDTAVSGDNLSKILQASHFHRCDDPLDISALACRGAMSGSARISDNELRLETRDPAIIAHFRKFRPAIGFHHAFEPEGRFYSDQFRILYR